ncbi:salicylate hydroxylase [Halopolyspora algeriensis]|uniref:Salicylate hydroxylase n=1 Tax=Halopolyspora algeriensis TaxID=1500506 RepID=A0A368VVJ6_9ACTN|nr:FAD-dependent monooxygenase [Halopolyspora algeriensis]RCW45223.1 salicylate hydroxylase [Halopolyspora algeriensis]TQM53058.1 salicylate hydroxylase [Halopolyspora algeriensis]
MAIVGGGIGGLTLALSLRSRGIVADVYEQASEFREVGAAVALSANGTRVLRDLGVGDRLDACSAVPTELIYRHWRDARRIRAFEAGESYEKRFGAPYYGVHRADLQQILVGACDPERVHLDHRIVDLTETADGVRLTFADGREATADVVVGADGVHSTVRSHITDTDTLRYSGTSGFRGLIPAEQLPNLPDPGAIQFWMGPGGHLLHYPIGSGEMINFLAVRHEPETWPDSAWMRPAPPEEIAAAFDGWHPAVVDMVTATSIHRRWALFTQDPSNRWHRGRVVLLGDAVHAMLPHHGQGANQSIEDAAVLAACLAEAEDPSAALDRYERLRRTRTRQVQRSSRVASDLLHLPDGPEAEQRDRNLATIDETLDWIHGHDATVA